MFVSLGIFKNDARGNEPVASKKGEEAIWTIRQAAADEARRQGIVTVEQHEHISEAIKQKDQKKFDSLLEQYGVKRQFYQILDQLIKSQQEQRQRAQSATSGSESMYQNLPQPLLGGNQDSEAYVENLEKAKKTRDDAP